MASTTKKKSTLSKTILSLLVTVPTILSVISKVAALIELEAQLAGKSLVRLVVLSVISGVLLTTTWLGILALLFNYLHSLTLSTSVSLSIILCFNIALLIIIGVCLSNTKKNLFFPGLRNQLHSLFKLIRD